MPGMTDLDRIQYKFMMPRQLRERIEIAAHENRRSVSAEIIATLSEAYPEPTAEEAVEYLGGVFRDLQLLIDADRSGETGKFVFEQLRQHILQLAEETGAEVRKVDPEIAEGRLRDPRAQTLYFDPPETEAHRKSSKGTKGFSDDPNGKHGN